MFNRSDLERKLQQGIDLAKRGDRKAARLILEEVIDADKNNERAWMWLASVVDTLNERRLCLERVIAINPGNTRAQEALRQLEATTKASGGTTAARTTGTRRPGGVQSTASTSNLIVLGLLGALVVGAFIVFTIVRGNTPSRGGRQPEPTATSLAPAVALDVTAQPTETPAPLFATATPFLVTLDPNRIQRTLPPTFTPTFTPTLTPTATPTTTPYPLTRFQAFSSSLESGFAQPALFSVAGDGSGEASTASAARDIAYDPSGEFVAFIRDVDYGSLDAEATVEAEATGEPATTFPELFVAPADDLNAAVQITELRSSIAASPTWNSDGRELIFVSNYDGDEDLWYITPDGENLYNITQNTAADRDPAWSPLLGNRQIVFASDIDSFGQTEIYTIEYIEPNVPLEYTRLTNATGSSWAPSWSPSGTLITFISDRSGDSDVYIMEPDGTGLRLMTEDDGDSEDRRPVFTPDARWIAFISNREDDRFQTYLLSLDGIVLTRITNHNRNDLSIVYRPDLALRLELQGQ
ncbi:MAG: hypothetical protein SF029_24290 [bacterium]|nr:hypothetical protein [bacterium]